MASDLIILAAAISIFFGALIIAFPRLLNYLVGFYLIIAGVIVLFRNFI